MERILIAVIFVLPGIYAATYIFVVLTWEHVLFALFLIFAVRPIARMAGLGSADVHPLEKRIMAFFGIRGVGS